MRTPPKGAKGCSSEHMGDDYMQKYRLAQGRLSEYHSGYCLPCIRESSLHPVIFSVGILSPSFFKTALLDTGPREAKYFKSHIATPFSLFVVHSFNQCLLSICSRSGSGASWGYAVTKKDTVPFLQYCYKYRCGMCRRVINAMRELE